MLVVVALGGNALLRRGDPARIDVQRRNVDLAVRRIAEIARRHDVVVTHGNGPQIGMLALQTVSGPNVDPCPLDVLGAESEGMIGYLLEQGLANELPERRVATMLTQVVVDRQDAAFARPTSPIGPLYQDEDARRLAREKGFAVAVEGEGLRRVVASPEPRAIVELEALRILVEAGVLVVCVGGGGIPVVVDRSGALRGVEAVIDKDLSAGLLARELGADFLLMLTDVNAVMRDWGTDQARPIRRAAPGELRAIEFASGSMGPKVEAACRFVEDTGGQAAIGALDEAASVLAGGSGTLVRAA
jgi:carbamate kinase